MERMVEGTQRGVLSQIKGKQARWNADGALVTPRSEIVREAAVIQSAMTYIGTRQVTVAQWVELWPIFEVCAR